MATIHGSSHKALMHFRIEPASLSVYWTYAARANNEGVAWPSIAGLHHDTGWAKDTCDNARDWLVKHEALEPVEDYIRPAWRKLDEATRKRRVNLDKAQYYRVTGRVRVPNTSTYVDMFYFGNQDAEDEDGTMSHRVGYHARHDVMPRGTELDSISTELSTNKTQLDSKKKKKDSSTPEGAEESKKIAAMIAAWWETLGELKVQPATIKNPYAIKAYRDYASNMVAAGWLEVDVKAYVNAMYTPTEDGRKAPFAGRPLHFKYVADSLAAWRSENPRVDFRDLVDGEPDEPEEDDENDEEAAPETSDRAAQAKALLEQLRRKTDGNK